MKEKASPFAAVLAVLSPLLEPLGVAALVAVLVIFMLLKYEDLRNRLIGLVGSGQLTVTTRALEDAGQRISRYLLMQFIINGSYGLAAGLGLFFLGVPYAVLWGFLAAVLRYIPYVGPWIAAFSPSSSAWWRFRGGCSLHWSLACLCSWNWGAIWSWSPGSTATVLGYRKWDCWS